MAVAEPTTRGDSDKTPWGRRTIIIVAVVMIVLAIYALSPGPAAVVLFRFDSARGSWAEDVLEVVYWPLAQVIRSNEQIEDWYQGYITRWLRITGIDLPFAP